MTDHKLHQEKKDIATILQNSFRREDKLISQAALGDFPTTLEGIRRFLNKGMKIITVTEDSALYAIQLAEEGFDVTAVVGLSPIKEHGTLRVRRMSPLDLYHLADKSFDAAILIGLLSEIKTEDSRYLCLMETRRILKDEGHIFVSTPTGNLYHYQQKRSLSMTYPWEQDVRYDLFKFMTSTVSTSEFYNDIDLKDGNLSLKLLYISPAMPGSDWAPAYYFRIMVDDVEVGQIDLRIGYNKSLFYGGNIGYRVHEEYRCNSYATRACLLLRELAKKHGMTFLSITNNYKNLASKRVCEKLGAELMRLTMVPIDSTIRKQGQVFQNNYYWYL